MTYDEVRQGNGYNQCYAVTRWLAVTVALFTTSTFVPTRDGFNSEYSETLAVQLK